MKDKLNKLMEVEGGEIVEYEGSNPIMVKGPKHEQGGVKMPNAPFKIYSNRIKVKLVR